MKTLSITLALIAILAGVSCSDSETGPITTAQKNAQDAQRLSLVPLSTNAVATSLTYCDEMLYRIELTRLSKTESNSVLSSGATINKIFSVVEFGELQPFHYVLDVDGNGAPFIYCVYYLIKFENGTVPYQFHSVGEIDGALISGEISVELSTNERIYKCVFL